MPPEQRVNDRINQNHYYTMKATGRPAPSPAHAHIQSHSRANSQSFFTSKPSNTPISSPFAPHSVGQPHPPKLSPSATRTQTQDVRTPSPNYFGLAVENTADPRDSSLLPRENWSSPSSSVKSFAAAIPKQLPLDANPEFEAFKRQIDANRGMSAFSLTGSHFNIMGPPPASTPSALQRPRPPRSYTQGSDASNTTVPLGPVSGFGGLSGWNPRARAGLGGKQDADAVSLQDSAYVSSDSKRNSEVSLNAPSFFNMGRHESPGQMEQPFEAPDRGRTNYNISRVDDRHPRLSMVHGKPDPPSPDPTKQGRADTVPPAMGNNSDPTMMHPSRLKELIEQNHDGDVLLLDLRVSPQYAQSRVKGALNLCIPTTLLKRATFNLQKLQQTFQAANDQEKFAKWNQASHLVVYDANSSDKRDAVAATNMLKKFTNEGFTGSASILRGGFNSFAAAYPELVDREPCGMSQPGLSLGGHGAGPLGARPSVAPVIGGVMLPNTSATPNPFFNNIRQNQDLVDGVGQMDIGVPAGLDKENLPGWLKEASAANDHGKKVSDKFLGIELAEQSRMKDAYSMFNPKPHEEEGTKVQLSGIEQGVKNRYKDILPFEHARVKLQGRPDGACDYVNASHIQASRSYKRYIASQGPLPATFEVRIHCLCFYSMHLLTSP